MVRRFLGNYGKYDYILFLINYLNMKKIYTFVVGLVSAFAANTIHAQITIFNYTGTTANYVVPAGVTSIRIDASGAQGGDGSGGSGGLGATMTGTFSVTPGETLTVIVGQQGAFYYNAGGGGGGTGVLRDLDPLIIAGGGGGAAVNEVGKGGVITETGGSSSGAGGSAGNGGQKGYVGGDCGWAAGGGGFLGDGYGGADGGDGGPLPGVLSVLGAGFSWVSGGSGGTNGSCFFTYPNAGAWGCGGGGAGAYGGGGGGGYSGGGGGQYVDVVGEKGGGGGGSYNEGSDQTNTPANRTGNGQVIIEVLCSGITVTVSDDVICLGDSFTLEGSGLGTISWDGGVENGVPFTPAAAGVFTYTSSSDDGGDCGYSLDIEVIAVPVVVAAVDETEVCLGESVIFTGSGADTYLWDMGVTDGAAFEPGLGTEVYTVTGTDAITGCENTDEIEVVVNDLPTVVANATDNEICLGESFTLTGSGATAYVWTPDGTLDGEEITPDATGTTTYEVTGTDDNGCVNTASIEVTVYEAVTITYTTEDEMMGADGSIDIAVTGGNPAYSFDWDNDGTGDFDDTEDLTGLAGGTYVVVIEDEAGCSINESILVSSQLGVSTNALPTLAIYPNPVRDNLTITQEGNFVYQLVTLEGKVLLSGTGLNQKVIDMNEFAKGVYLLNVTENGQEVSTKVVVE
jgi:hypothetical protein